MVTFRTSPKPVSSTATALPPAEPVAICRPMRSRISLIFGPRLLAVFSICANPVKFLNMFGFHKGSY